MYPDCLKDLVGITTEDKGCFEGSSISNTSSLGLFVNQDAAWDSCRLKGGDTYCELMKMTADMREEALRLVTVDVSAMLSGKVKTRQECNYSIGQNEYGAYYAPELVPVNPFVEIYTEKVQGAYIRIDRIALMILPIAGDIVVPLKVYRVVPEGEDILVHTWQIPVTRFSTNASPVISYNIPCDGSVYRIEYTFNQATMQVVDSNYHCGCGDKLKCSRGFIKENISKTWGIHLWTTMYCAQQESICGVLANETFKLVVAHMIRKKTITLLLTKITNQQDVNRYTLLSQEDIQAQLLAYNQEYTSRLEWLGEQRDIYVNSHCFVCGTQTVSKFNMLTGR